MATRCQQDLSLAPLSQEFQSQISEVSSIGVTWINDWLPESFVKRNTLTGHLPTLRVRNDVSSIHTIWLQSWEKKVSPRGKSDCWHYHNEKCMWWQAQLTDVTMLLSLLPGPWFTTYQLLVVYGFTLKAQSLWKVMFGGLQLKDQSTNPHLFLQYGGFVLINASKFAYSWRWVAFRCNFVSELFQIALVLCLRNETVPWIEIEI